MVVKSFLEHRANPNQTTKKTDPRIGVMAGQCVLSICTWWHNNEAGQLLLDAKADVSIGIIPAMALAAHKNNVDAEPHFKACCDPPTQPVRNVP